MSHATLHDACHVAWHVAIQPAVMKNTRTLWSQELKELKELKELLKTEVIPKFKLITKNCSIIRANIFFLGDSPRIYRKKIVVTAKCPKTKNGRNSIVKFYRKTPP
jgi:hypothetical protein